MGGGGGRTGGGGTFPTAEVCDPRVPPFRIKKIGPHLRLQDTKCSSIMPPRKSGAPPGAPWKLDPSYATNELDIKLNEKRLKNL